MPPPTFKHGSDSALFLELLEVFFAGHHRKRPDLPYPESHSDLKWAFIAVMQEFEIKRRTETKHLEFQ